MALPTSKKLLSSFLGVGSGMDYRSMDHQISVLGLDFDFFTFAQSYGAGYFKRHPDR
jgi:hypothetical protein